MKISFDEARRRLQSSSNLTNLVSVVKDPQAISSQANSISSQAKQSHVTHIEKLRPKRGPQIPEFLRDTMANLVAQEEPGHRGTGHLIGDAFGVSRMSVSNAARGMSGGRPPDENRRRKMEERQLDAKDTALNKLMLSLNLITEEGLQNQTPKDLSLIAKNMAGVMHAVQEVEGGKAAVNITVYTPEMKNVGHFKVIDV